MKNSSWAILFKSQGIPIWSFGSYCIELGIKEKICISLAKFFPVDSITCVVVLWSHSVSDRPKITISGYTIYRCRTPDSNRPINTAAAGHST